MSSSDAASASIFLATSKMRLSWYTIDIGSQFQALCDESMRIPLYRRGLLCWRSTCGGSRPVVRSRFVDGR